MGGSLRRKKKHRPRIVKRGKKEGLRRSKVPEELTAERPDFRKKLGARWRFWHACRQAMTCTVPSLSIRKRERGLFYLYLLIIALPMPQC